MNVDFKVSTPLNTKAVQDVYKYLKMDSEYASFEQFKTEIDSMETKDKLKAMIKEEIKVMIRLHQMEKEL